jgi:hypothetical protein
MTNETRKAYDLTESEMNGHSVYSDLAAQTGSMSLTEWIEAHVEWATPLDELKAALESDVAQVEAITEPDGHGAFRRNKA